MSYYSSKNSTSDQETATSGTGTSNAAASCCSRPSSDLKLYQAFIFSIPIFFTFILLFLFYLFYLRRRRVDWSSLRMRTGNSMPTSDDVSRCELGLKKELREMLPIIVFNESFSVKDAQCSVCLGEYQGEERLQQIPGCGHTFHMDCIDLWLATHTTCPLCRQSLIASTKVTTCPHEDTHLETDSSTASNARQTNDEDPQTSSSETTSRDRIVPTVVVGERDIDDDDVERGIVEIVK